MSLNLAELVRGHAGAHPDKPALVCRDETLTYAECASRIDALAAALRQQGLGAGDRIALALPETPDHVLLHFAIAAIGAVLLPLDHRASDAEHDAACAAFGARTRLTAAPEIGASTKET